MSRPQGTLNRLFGYIAVTSNNALSVDFNSLGPEGIRLAFDDNATDLLPTMSGMVTSPKPYQACTLTVSVVKTVPLGQVYMNQFLTNTLIGDVVVWPDTAFGNQTAGPGNPITSGISPFNLSNMALENVREMSFAGTEAVFLITMKGYYIVNAFLAAGAPTF